LYARLTHTPRLSRHYHTLFLPIYLTHVISSSDMHEIRILDIGTDDVARAGHREGEEDDSDDESQVGVVVTRDQGPEPFAGRRRCHKLATNFTMPFAFPPPACLSAAVCMHCKLCTTHPMPARCAAPVIKGPTMTFICVDEAEGCAPHHDTSHPAAPSSCHLTCYAPPPLPALSHQYHAYRVLLGGQRLT
jgi:hypothetical protein